MSGKDDISGQGQSADLSRVEGSTTTPAGDQGVEAAPLEKLESGVSSASVQDPKNVQELTMYIQSILQQMQDRFTVSLLLDLQIQIE